MIDCVTLETNHLFVGNPIASQHHLRYSSVIKRQDWKVPSIRQMEYDTYDNPATSYLIWRDDNGVARGVSRLCPTDRPYMLKDAFPFLVSDIDMPSDKTVWEGSRFCVDKNLPPKLRKKIINEIVLGYLEFGLLLNIEYLVGVMLPAYWNNIFVAAGWDVDFIGERTTLPNGDKVRAGRVKITQETLQIVRERTGIHKKVLYFGNSNISKEIFNDKQYRKTSS